MKLFITTIILLYTELLLGQDTLSMTKTIYEAGLRSTPFPTSTFTDTIPPDSEIAVIDFQNNFWHIKSGNKEGYISSSVIWKTRPMYSILNQSKQENAIEKYGQEIGDKINSRQVWIGMSKNMLLDSKGSPEKINKTEGEWGLHEQWVYPSYYIYLENGFVTAIQS